MSQLVVRPARGAADLFAVRALCRAYRADLDARWPDHPQFLARYYNTAEFEGLLARLPELHRPPRGEIFVADLGGRIVGCGMTHEIAAGVSEIKRVFVTEAARGHGAGRRICQAAMERARGDGYERMVLDTTTRLTEAIALYQRLGFAPIAPFYDPPEDFAENLLFFGRDL
ncbi:GNAT family N-acetyltransferase [Pseudodonghicola flavimaris]|uniref:GNAT family N-acetyltransferase n=1 Tax=Pseudodonghicola flavimaris TaxID=3050036 RepID=A0ABT7EVJ7_9RHOB|nr:GNAT family N-acetyltransferase [Pseudodonghicola flavimaris]MDK3016371.1 GNAT family N-acetyltransferase [Pseudodonghicola flavimaris]